MRRSVVAALAALFVVVSFVYHADAQKARRSRAKSPLKKPAALSSGAVRTPSGLIYLITQKGTGRIPKAGEAVAYHYTGTFTDGVKFDSSHERLEPLVFTLGAGDLIKGMDEGISKLRVGDRAILVLPSEIAYGARGTPGGPIPPNATLVFVVDVVDVKGLSLSHHLYQTGQKSGWPAMTARYRELKTAGFAGYYVAEGDLNRLGYRLIRLKQMDAAIDLFKLIVEEYPKSANPHDSLGEAYMIAGKKQLAIESYEKALLIDPKFDSAIKALEKLRSAP